MGTADKVAKVVGEVIVVSGDNSLVGYGAVVGIGHLGKSVVTHCINAEYLCELVCVYNVTLGL